MLNFPPGMLQRRADLHFKLDIPVALVFHQLAAGIGKPQDHMDGIVAKIDVPL